MEFKRDIVVERIKEAKNYGLKYANLARAIDLQPMTIYLFVNGNTNLSKEKQLEALCIIEDYINNAKERLRKIEHKGVAINE